MTPPAIDSVAFERLREITGDDDVFLAELIDTYLEDGTRQVADLRAAAAVGDPGAMLRPAHTLKSASDSIGAHRLAAACRTLEGAARDGAIPEPVARAEEIAAAFDEAAIALALLRPSA